MKFYSLISLASIAIGTVASASTSKEDNQAKLHTLQAHRTGVVWSCKNGENNDEALVMFTVDRSVSGLLSGSKILAIQDEKICNALGVTCPFVASASDGTFGLVAPVKHEVWATRGKYEDTLMFLSDGPGMKVVSVSNGSQQQVNWDLNWYFGPGDCILHPYLPLLHRPNPCGSP